MEFQKFINYLSDDFRKWDIQYRIHATQRMFKRDISEQEIWEIIENGFIIEDYGDDFPFPSLLINGRSGKNRQLHVVLGIDRNSKRLFVITTYEPDEMKWEDNFNRRKQK